jgi:hypothetical protein
VHVEIGQTMAAHGVTSYELRVVGVSPVPFGNHSIHPLGEALQGNTKKVCQGKP